MLIFLFGLLGGLTNRIRGGLFKHTIFFSSTHLLRVFWSLVFALVCFFGSTPWDALPYMETGYVRLILLFGAGWASWALFGSGAHQEMDFTWWKGRWAMGVNPNQTEIFTSWWLPRVFGGLPNASWTEEKFLTYHIIGKSTEGFLRNLVAISPLLYLEWKLSVVYILSGLTWGTLYYFAWISPKALPIRNAPLGEILVGFLSFSILGVMYYG